MLKRSLLRIGVGTTSVFLIVLAGAMAFINTSPQFGAPPSGVHLEKIRNSKNYNGQQFNNLIPTSMDMSFGKAIGVMYEWLFKTEGREPDIPLPVQFGEKQTHHMDTLTRITWFGHSAILLEINTKKILIDPMLGDAASPLPFLTKRFAYQRPIDLGIFSKIDAVVLSHDHYDHLDYSSIMKLKDNVDHFFTPLGVGSHLVRWGVEETKITELDWWESADMDQIHLVATPARHFSGRGITDRNKTQWASWVIQGKSDRIYFSGDSGYGPHFREIGERYGPFDLAMMECGQYDERWEAIHMLPEQTVMASLDVRCKMMMPIHWSAFNLSLHPWIEPVERAIEAAKTRDINIHTPQIGQRFSLHPGKTNELWWREL